MGLVHGEAPGFVMLPLQLDGGGALIVSTLPAGANLIGRVDARGGDKIFSITNRLALRATNFVHGAGQIVVTSGTPPAGTYWIITHAHTLNASGPSTIVSLNVLDAGITTSPILAYAAPLGAGVPLIFISGVGLVLAPGDTIFGQHAGVAVNDNLYLDFWGWRMQV